MATHKARDAQLTLSLTTGEIAEELKEPSG
jgi:hypothetical protein